MRERGKEGYAFDHALTRGSLDAELSSRRRRRLHLAAGEALEALPERKRDTRAAELAWHFLEGDDPRRALRWSLTGGDAAEEVFAHSDAEGQYRTALQLAEEEGWEGEAQIAREKLGRTLMLVSRYSDALEVFESALGRYQRAGDTESEMRVLAEITLILFDQGRREEGLARVEPVLDRWRQDPQPSAGACSLLIGVADLYWHAGRMDDALAAAQQAVELARRMQNDGLLGWAESRLGVLLAHVAREEEALAAYSRSIPFLERAGDLSILVSTLNNRALLYAATGQMEEGYADFDRALDLARKVGTPDQIGWQLVLRASTAFAVEGDWPRARALLDEVEPLERYMKGTRSAFHVTMARWIRLQAEYDLSMVDELEQLAEEGRRTGDDLLWAGAQMWLAQCDVLEGRIAGAIARCRSVQAKSEVEDQFRTGTDSTLAWACIECGEYDAADELIRQGVAHVGAGSPYQSLQWLSLLGRLRAAQGRWSEARAAFEQALTQARDAKFVLGEALILYSYGDMLARRGDSPAARTTLMEARSLFDRIHARFYIHFVDRALAPLPDARERSG